MQNVSLQDRYRGVLVGVLAGDALGAPYEKSWTPEQIAADFAVRGGLVPFDYDDPWGKDGRFPAGRPTDDSELTAVLAECLINGDDDEAAYQRFRRCVIDHQSALCTLKAYGFGGTTRYALRLPSYAEALADSEPTMSFPSNGSLMRTSPVALRYHQCEASLEGVARRAARFTHRHLQAVDCTAIYALLLGLLLKGYSYARAAQAMKKMIHLYTRDPELKDIFELPAARPRTTRKFDGTALYTLKVAHYVTALAKDFRDGITRAVAFGGDTDTYAAVAGGWLGAIYGIDGIPQEWQKVLLGRDRMIELADRLYERRLADR